MAPLAGVKGSEGTQKENGVMGSLSIIIIVVLLFMIVCYFNGEGVAIGKAENYPPLIIDPYAVFPLQLAFHPLEPVAWKDHQVLYFPG